MSDCRGIGGFRSPTLTRRQFIETAATAGWLGVLAAGRATVFAQKREMSMLTWNHIVPASDERLKELATKFSKRHTVTLKVATIAHSQLPAKWAAEVQTRTGHDRVFTYSEAPSLYERFLVSMDDVDGAGLGILPSALPRGDGCRSAVLGRCQQ